ncbi:pumilio domain-containing protein kiaa0020homolog [Lichtheimia corymbifera JMRC:FSU:9682]|uniref:Pumilio domain-containing protein kiaa0020homolog n=1 Tax=Lichtheimia corymbifera JMRC:FSU:9682 TaxID=1263082 RepID=A0A068RNA5_9FUNG|nr:pumilio domain-containing protein kiaa0020homolog [Lichtheimia corymbifera JMRC:FSU:9682]
MAGLKRKATSQADGDDTNKKSKSGSHQQQKALKLERKAQDPKFDMMTKTKKIWETLRRGDISKEETKDLMSQIMALIAGHVKEVIFKHDASRIIQTCLKKGNSEQRNQIVSELNGHFEELAKSMYGKFIVLKALEYCPKQRDQVLSEFRTHVRKLIRHKDASTVVETFYAQYSNATQRNELLAEFYGPEMTLFNRGGGAKTLEGLLESLPEKKDSVLKFMSETLIGCTDKGTIVHSIVHKALLQYLTYADAKDRENMMAHIRDNLQEILHTREGAKVAMICISYASPKDRKAIVKNFKQYLVKIAQDEYGHLVLIRLLDVMDDTVLINKAVINELCKNATDLFADKFGRRVFLYILAGRNTKYFSPETVRQMNEGDAIRQSKKDPEVRAKEILNEASPLLIDTVAKKAPVLMREKLSSQVVQEILLHATGDKTAAINAILDLASENIEKENHIMQDRFGNRVIKAMVKADSAEETNDKAVEPLEFAPQLLERIKPHVGFYATNFGSFVIVALTEVPSTSSKMKKLLKPHKKDIQQAASENNAGAKILIELL